MSSVDRPSREVMAAVRESVVVLAAGMPAFAGACYDHLIALVPTLLTASADRGRVVADELAHHLVRAAASDDDLPAPVADRLIRAGAQLYRQGLSTDGYQGASHAVLRAARDCYPHDWESTLGSAWVAYLGWAVSHLAEGARSASLSGVPVPASVTPAPTSLASLPQIFQFLSSGAFVGNAKALDSVVTRVALRTGADLRHPRQDQQDDPAVVALVLSTLTRMGYLVGAQPAGEQAAAEQWAGERRLGEQRLGEQRLGEQRVSEQRAGEQRAGEQRAWASVQPQRQPARKARWWNRRSRSPGEAVVPLPATAHAGGLAPAPASGPITLPGGLQGKFDAFSDLGPAGPTSGSPGLSPAGSVRAPAGSAPSPAALPAPRTLTEVLGALRAGAFADNEWALEGVLTRVALRTGADIRAPRPDQVADPVVVRDVLTVLGRMGYGTGATATLDRPRWWARQRRPDRIA